MLVVGLTGGIGSGKSTVATLFAERGVPIIDADVAARQVTTPDRPAFTTIVKHFGPDIVQKDGTLDRPKLRHLIFTDAKQRLWLEKLLHPAIRDEMQKQIDTMTAPYCIAVIPLLLEVEFYAFINRILVVDAPETEQVSRVMARDRALKEEVEAILHSQARRHDRRAKAHDIIINDGVFTDLIPQVDRLHELYTKIGQLKT